MIRKPRRSSKEFVILSLKLLIFLVCAVFGIWCNLAAWNILIRCVPLICLQIIYIYIYFVVVVVEYYIILVIIVVVLRVPRTYESAAEGVRFF